MAKRILFWATEGVLTILGLCLVFILLPYKFLGFVSLCLALLLGCYGALHLLIHRFGKPFAIIRRVLTVLVCLGLALVCVTEAMVIRASLGDPEKSCQYLVVLGCMVRDDGPSSSLQNRIDAAYAYLTEHPQVIAIVSGGQGEDEPMTEAQCMADHLQALGIAPERIWLEEKATSTWENLQFSLALIEEKTGTRPQTIGLLSSEYHLLRASLLAKDQGVDTVKVPAKTTDTATAINHFLREVAGIWHYTLLGGLYD